MRTSLLAGLTTRGSSFLAAGIAAGFTGYLLGEQGLLCVGVALVALPLLAAAAASRGQYRLSVSRSISPPRVPAGHTATVTLRMDNVSRAPTGLLLAEDAVPYALGARPRYVLDRIERNGTRELTYPLRSDLRGKFEIGPLQLRVADSFGLVEVSRSLSGRTSFIVTPRVVPLARTVISRSWAGEGHGRARLASTAGEDDAIPRAYRDGDELRRVHWRSTARYGELMVRREEQRWRNKATVLLDSRSMSHMGTGPGSSFEMAVSAAASLGVHISQEGLTGQFITESEVIRGGHFFEDMLLDALAVIRPSNARTLDRTFKELKVSGAGVIIAVMGKMSAAEARHLAACRTAGSQGIALLLDVATWADASRRPSPRATPAITDTSGSAGNGQAGAGSADGAASAGAAGLLHDGGSAADGTAAGRTGAAAAESAPAAAVLRGAGWHVTTLDAGTPLAIAWQRLPRAAEMLVATPTTVHPGMVHPDAVHPDTVHPDTVHPDAVHPDAVHPDAVRRGTGRGLPR